MRKIFLISGFLTVILIILFFTGIIDLKNGRIEALVKGNRLYASGNYTQALQVYNNGLQEKPGDIKLNYNSGQASYRLNEYVQAIEYYNKTPGRVDKYLNSGNASLKLGDAVDDTNQKSQYYQQALLAYKQGIIQFPQNVALKYNYEYVKNKIEQLQNENNENQNEQNEGQNKDQKEEQNEGQDKEQNNEQNKGENGEQNKDQSSSSLNESDSSQSEQNGSDPEQVLQVLEMLEKQEEGSLKNNQKVINKGKGEEHDW